MKRTPAFDTELQRRMIEADTRFFEEVKLKYGEKKALVLSEIANLANIAGMVPMMRSTVRNLIVQAIAAFDIETTEGMMVIKTFQEFRSIEVGRAPTRQAH